MATSITKTDTTKKKLFDLQRVITGGRVYEIAKSEVQKLGSDGIIDMAFGFIKGDDSIVKTLATNIGTQATAEAKVNLKNEPVYPLVIVGGVVVGGFAVYGMIEATVKIINHFKGKNGKRK